MEEQFSWQILLNFIAVYLIRFIETSQWSYLKKIDENLVWCRRGIILICSTATAAGLVFHFEIKTGDFVVQGNAWTVIHAVKHIGQNYVGIQGLYWVKSIHDLLREFKKKPPLITP